MELRSGKIKRIWIDAKTGSGDGTYTLELFEPLRPKKVSSTWIPQLLGEGGFNPKGDKLLEFWGLIKKEDFNKYYELRGAIAEDLLQGILEAKGHTVKRFPKEENDYDYFQYQENNNEPLNRLYRYFGGLPDLVSKLNDETFLYEVKSKELEKMEDIIANPPQYEVMQGKTLALLYGLNKVVMVWFFFTDAIVRQMYSAVQSTVPFDLEKALEAFKSQVPNMVFKKDYQIFRKDYEFSQREHLELMKDAYKYADGFRQTLTVKASDLSKKMASQLFKLEGELEDEFKPKNKRTK